MPSRPSRFPVVAYRAQLTWIGNGLLLCHRDRCRIRPLERYLQSELLRNGSGGAVRGASAANLEEMSFWETPALREAIHAREGGRCFYCMRRVKPAVRRPDHVIPQVRGGSNSYRNLVSSCMECNSRKLDQRAEDFLRWLFREGQLTAPELKGRLRALEDLAAGKMRPKIGGNGA